MTLITFLCWSITCAIFSFMLHKLHCAHNSENSRLWEIINSDKKEKDCMQRNIDGLKKIIGEMEIQVLNSEESKKFLRERLGEEIYKNKFLRY